MIFVLIGALIFAANGHYMASIAMICVAIFLKR